jgi:uncharacterized protein DUF4340
MNARTRIALSTLVLLAAALVALAVAWFGVHRRGEERAREEARAKKIFDLDPALVKEIEVQAKGTDVKLVRAGEAWRIAAPVATGADPAAVRRLLDRLASLERRSTSARSGTSRDELKWYGLAEPRARIAFARADGRRETLALGDDNGFDGAMFVMPTGGDVEVVAGGGRADLDQGLTDLRDKRVLVFEEGAVTRIEVRGPKLAFALAREGDAWRIAQPLAERADDGAAARILGALHTLQATEVVDRPEPPARYGLDRPRYEVKLTLADGSSQALAAGEPPGAAQGAPLWARRAGAAEVLAVPASALSALDQDLLALRDKRVLRFDKDAVAAIRFEAGVGTVEVRKEPPAQPGGADLWKLAAPRAAPAQGWKVSGLLWTLASLDASGFADETGKKLAESGLSPPRETVVLLAKDGKEIARLLVGKEAGEKVLVKGGASSRIFEVEKARLATLPRTADDLEEKPTPAATAPKGR